MKQLHPIDQEQRLASEKRKKLVGSASVHLDALDFQHEVDEENVKRLVALLHDSSCDRAETRNHVIATIDQCSLDQALTISALRREMLAADIKGRYPELNLPPGLRLQCLHGVDRLAAARRALRPDDRRWVVDLYLSGTLYQASLISVLV